MEKPDISIFAVSNVYSRIMHFKQAGDVELGHYHTYDHGTLISAGSIQLDILDDECKILQSKIVKAPQMILIKKDKRHRLTALENNTVAVCIHALRDVEGELLPVETLEDVVHHTPDEDRKALLEKRNSNSLYATLIKRDIIVENMVDDRPRQ